MIKIKHNNLKHKDFISQTKDLISKNLAYIYPEFVFPIYSPNNIDNIAGNVKMIDGDFLYIELIGKFESLSFHDFSDCSIRPILSDETKIIGYNIIGEEK